MSEKSFRRIEVRLTLVVSDKTQYHERDAGGSATTLFTADATRIPISAVQVVERVNESPIAMVNLVLGEPFEPLEGGARDSVEYLSLLARAVDEQLVCIITMETITYNISDGKKTQYPEEAVFIGHIISPTTQLMRKDVGSQIQLRHIVSTLSTSSILSAFAIETNENRFASAALWSGSGPGQGLSPGQAELIISRLDIPKDTLQKFINGDVFKAGPIEILRRFAEKSIPKILQHNWSKCADESINLPHSSIAATLSSQVATYATLRKDVLNAGSRQLIASRLFDAVCNRTLRDFAGGTYWDKLQEYCRFLDLVCVVSTGGKASAPYYTLSFAAMGLSNPSPVNINAEHITDLRWQANTNTRIRGVVLAATTASPTNLAIPSGIKTYGCFIDSKETDRGAVRELSPPVWLSDVWVGAARSGNALNYSVVNAGVMGTAASTRKDDSVTTGVNAAAAFGKDEFADLLDRYAKWIYLQIAFAGRTVTFATQERVETTAPVGVNVNVNVNVNANANATPTQPDLNVWVCIDAAKFNERFTKRTSVKKLYGLVVAKTLMVSREQAVRSLNYQLDYVMTEDEYQRYKMLHPVWTTG